MDYAYWQNIDSVWSFNRGLVRVSRDYYLDLVDHYKPRSFLDLGCGFGDTYNLFKMNGIKLHYVGIDITPGFIIECKRRYPEIDFMIGRIQEIPHPSGSFDLTGCRCVLEHLPDPIPAIKEMARVSRGVVVIVWFKWPSEIENYKYNKRGFWENDYPRDKILDTMYSVNLTLVDEIVEAHHLVWTLEKQ